MVSCICGLFFNLVNMFKVVRTFYPKRYNIYIIGSVVLQRKTQNQTKFYKFHFLKADFIFFNQIHFQEKKNRKLKLLLENKN